jgi:hypothetical protein
MPQTSTTRQKLFNFSRQQEEPLVVLGMAIAIAGCIVLCAINPQLLDNITLQSLTSAAFAVFAAALYLVYMIISRMVALVLLHIESRRGQHALLSEEPLLADEEDEPGDDALSKLPREAVISSMYLGGTGAFLAIPPLCMWDISISSSFALSLLAIAFLDASKVAIEFRANVDTAAAISNLKRLRLFHIGSIVNTLICIMWLDGQDRAVALIPHPNATSAPSGDNMMVVVGQQWPLVLLAASSPFLLRGGPSRRCMSPSQTLETGLPVCTLLAILILCWYGPLENIMISNFHSPLRTVLPMLILCPPCIAAALAFVLYSLKCKHAAVPATLLSIALFVRQQILSTHRMAHRGDWLALSAVVNSLVVSIVFWVYRRKVVWTPCATAQPLDGCCTPKEEQYSNNSIEEEEQSIEDLQP